MHKSLLADASLTQVVALPSGAASVTSKGIDLGQTATSSLNDAGDLQVSAPAVTTAMLANGETISYDIVSGDSVDANNVIQAPVVIAAAVLVQTGAGGVGSGAAEMRVGVASDCQKYVGLKITKSVSGDASSVNASLRMLF